MAIIEYRKKHRRQPKGPTEVNRAAVAGEYITTLIPFGVDSRDIISGRALTIGAGASPQTDVRGRSLKGSGSAAFASLPLNLSAFDKITVSLWLYWDAFANDDDLAFEFSNNSNNNNGFYLDPNSGGGGFECHIGPFATRSQKYSTRPSAAAWHHVALVLDRSTTGGVTAIYIDGAAQSLTTVAANTPGSTFANDTLYFLSRNNASLFGAGRIQNFVIRGGYLMSAAEVASEYQRPWQLFAPKVIPVPVSAGGGTNGNASTTPASSSLTAPTATGSGSAQASAVPAGTTLTAPTATASASAQASGALAGASLTAPTATATGTAADGYASGEIAGMYLAAPTATASNGETADTTGGRRKAKNRRLSWQEYDVPMPAEVLTSTVPADKVVEPIAQPKADPLASKLATRSALRKKPAAVAPPAVQIKPAAPDEPPAQVAATQPAPEAAPPVAAAVPRPMMLSDILNAQTMTPEEMMAAIKMLARLHMGPQLERSPRPQLIRGR